VTTAWGMCGKRGPGWAWEAVLGDGQMWSDVQALQWCHYPPTLVLEGKGEPTGKHDGHAAVAGVQQCGVRNELHGDAGGDPSKHDARAAVVWQH
jgi:hypothetical protein